MVNRQRLIKGVTGRVRVPASCSCNETRIVVFGTLDGRSSSHPPSLPPSPPHQELVQGETTIVLTVEVSFMESSTANKSELLGEHTYRHTARQEFPMLASLPVFRRTGRLSAEQGLVRPCCYSPVSWLSTGS